MNSKVIVVTGGGRDIGRAISIKFAEAGAKVVINYCHSPELAKETLDMIKNAGGEASLVQADLTKAKDVEKLYNETKRIYGNADILINNAGGIIGRRTLAEMDEAFYNDVMDLNFKSVVLVSKAFIPNMPSGSTVVNVSSQAARDGGGGGSALYSASKAATSTFTKAMAKEFGPKGIRVNAVCPGMIDTLFHDMFTKPEIRTHVANVTPLKREGVAMEVANLVYFLASDASSYITGANYDINGGMVFS